MKNLNVKNLLALASVLLLVFVVVNQFSRSPERTAPAERQSRKARKGKPPTELDSLLVNLLEPKALTTREDGRNIFRYGPPPAPETPPPPPGPTPEEIQRRREQQQRRLAAQQNARPATPPKAVPPSIDFKFLGSFGPEGRLLAVFSNGEEILDVFEGEVFLEKFIVRKIGMESVTIGFVGFEDEQVEVIEVGS